MAPAQTPAPRKAPVPGDTCDRCHQALELEDIGSGRPTRVVGYHTVLPEHAVPQAAEGHYHDKCCPYPYCHDGAHMPDQAEFDNAKNGRPAGWTPPKPAEHE